MTVTSEMPGCRAMKTIEPDHRLTLVVRAKCRSVGVGPEHHSRPRIADRLAGWAAHDQT